MSSFQAQKKILKLIQVDVVSGIPTGQKKDNLLNDPDYIAPDTDVISCPIKYTTWIGINGTSSCEKDSENSNTGYKIYSQLQEIYTSTSVPTGRTKNNVQGQPDYIAPILDITTCTIPLVVYSFKFIVDNTTKFCVKNVSNNNTGYQGWNVIKKVVDGGIRNGQLLDVNNNLCSISNLANFTKNNVQGQPDYIVPVLNEGLCPLPSQYPFKWIPDENSLSCELTVSDIIEDIPFTNDSPAVEGDGAGQVGYGYTDYCRPAISPNNTPSTNYLKHNITKGTYTFSMYKYLDGTSHYGPGAPEVTTGSGYPPFFYSAKMGQITDPSKYPTTTIVLKGSGRLGTNTAIGRIGTNGGIYIDSSNNAFTSYYKGNNMSAATFRLYHDINDNDFLPFSVQNTGNKTYSNLLKVVNGGSYNLQPLDVNNQLVSVSGLPQDNKSNSQGQADYIAPYQDLNSCPLPNNHGGGTVIMLTGYNVRIDPSSYPNNANTLYIGYQNSNDQYSEFIWNMGYLSTENGDGSYTINICSKIEPYGKIGANGSVFSLSNVTEVIGNC
jgi:hypothetical protein